MRPLLDDHDHHGRAFWCAFVAGVALVGFGVRGAIRDADATGPVEFFTWIVGANLVHDVVIAPVVCAIGVVLARVVPEPLRTPVRSGLVVTALVVLVSWPALRGYGRDRVPDNATVQPLRYGTAVLTVLAIVWIAVAAWAFVHARRNARRSD